MSNYKHISFASEEMAVEISKLPSMRWAEQQDTLENIIAFHSLDIQTCDYDWVLGKAEQIMHEMGKEIKRAGW